VFWPVVVVIVIADIVTKLIALSTLPPFTPQPVLGEGLRLTLVRNKGAAFGLYLGDYSRYIFMVLTVGALVILWRLYQSTREGDLPRTLAIALVCAGAVGNLIDRIRWHEGVVDFIDVGFRDMRWPRFNVADMAGGTGRSSSRGCCGATTAPSVRGPKAVPWRPVGQKRPQGEQAPRPAHRTGPRRSCAIAARARPAAVPAAHLPEAGGRITSFWSRRTAMFASICSWPRASTYRERSPPP